MTHNGGLPWTKINDFLVVIGSARTLEELDRSVVSQIGRLIPHDRAAATFLFHSRVPVISSITPGWEHWRREFNDYHRRRFPLRFDGNPVQNVEDFSPWADTEYVSSFLRPAGVGRALSITRGRYQVAVLRSRQSPPFSRTDARILDALRPHLVNLYHLLADPPGFGAGPMRAVELDGARGPLTRREAQVVACLCRRMTSRQIGSALGMSPRTVERHIENMYDKLAVHSRAELLRLLTNSTFVGPLD